MKYKLLNTINYPDDLRKLTIHDLPHLSEELRNYLIDTITMSGGHLGSGLGVLELTVALHYVYDTPKDKIVFDVGHQAYPHKILTGRREQLHTIRHKNGLSGFPNRNESKYDDFGVGHASTSISAALGIASARDLKGEDYRVAAIIGDGAMTGGLAFEAMNNCGFQNKKVLIILNDNNISIDSNVSGFSEYFSKFYATNTAQSIKDGLWNTMGKMPSGDRLRKFASRLENSIKAIITPGVLFESLGFNYFGPIDGNNVTKLVAILNKIKDINGPVLLHIITKKGKGYLPAEQDIQKLHAVSGKTSITGNSNGKKIPKYSDVFGNAMLEICEKDKNVVGISAAMLNGTGLDIVQAKYPKQIFDVGIAEMHAVTFAAGLATQGIVPVVAIYSSFLQRAYDGIIHDVALQNQHVVFALDRAGIVGEDGPTHHGTFDLAYLRTVPNLVVTAPKDEQELRNLLHSAIYSYKNKATAIRYPRGKAVGVEMSGFEEIPLGSWEVLKKGDSIAVLAVGTMVQKTIEAATILKRENISVEVINARFIKPIDERRLKYTIDKFDKIITIEEGQYQGGFGSYILEIFAKEGIKKCNVFTLGLPDRFIEHGKTEELLADIGLDVNGIVKTIRKIVKN